MPVTRTKAAYKYVAFFSPLRKNFGLYSSDSCWCRTAQETPSHIEWCDFQMNIDFGRSSGESSGKSVGSNF